MDIIEEYPPNISEIREKFKLRAQGTVFTYGDKVYSPDSGGHLSGDLMAHEDVHSKQQKAIGIKKWWKQYLNDDDFRLKEELLSYRAQWRFCVNNYGRPQRRKVLRHMVRDLASPMYGNLVNEVTAEHLITGRE